MNEYFKLQDMGISIWKRFISFDFKKEIEKQNITASFFASITDKRNYYGLGHFNYIVDLCSNIFIPSSKLSTQKPKSNAFFEYLFSQNKLVIVKHVYDKDVSLLYFILDDYIFQLTSSYEVSSIYFISKNTQMQISQAGIYINYLKKIEQNLYQNIFCDLFSFTDSIFEYCGSSFVEKEIKTKILKNYEEIKKLNENVNPYPFSQKFISNGVEMLKKSGYHEE